MANIVVTGANGFIGRNLIRRLKALDCRIYAVYRSKERAVFEDGNIITIECPLDMISSMPNLINERIDIFYHFAWEGSTGSLRSDYGVQLNNAKAVCDA